MQQHASFTTFLLEELKGVQLYWQISRAFRDFKMNGAVKWMFFFSAMFSMFSRRAEIGSLSDKHCMWKDEEMWSFPAGENRANSTIEWKARKTVASDCECCDGDVESYRNYGNGKCMLFLVDFRLVNVENYIKKLLHSKRALCWHCKTFPPFSADDDRKLKKEHEALQKKH